MRDGSDFEGHHFKFAGELAANVLVRGVAEKDKTRVFGEKLEEIANLVDLFALIDQILLMSVEDRGLLPLR